MIFHGGTETANWLQGRSNGTPLLSSLYPVQHVMRFATRGPGSYLA